MEPIVFILDSFWRIVLTVSVVVGMVLLIGGIRPRVDYKPFRELRERTDIDRSEVLKNSVREAVSPRRLAVYHAFLVLGASMGFTLGKTLSHLGVTPQEHWLSGIFGGFGIILGLAVREWLLVRWVRPVLRKRLAAEVAEAH